MPTRQDNQSAELFGQTPWQTVGPFFHFGLPWSGCADLTGPSDLGARPDLWMCGFSMPCPVAGAEAGASGVEQRGAPRGQPLGERVQISGRMLDAAGAPLPDGLLEIWQANAAGYYRDPAAASVSPASAGALDRAFFGFGRAATAEDGSFRFLTIRPGRVPFAPSASQGPGADVLSSARQAPHIAVNVLGRGLLKRLMTRIYFADEPSNAEDPILKRVPEARRGTLLARRLEGAANDALARYHFDIHLQGVRETVFFEC